MKDFFAVILIFVIGIVVIAGLSYLSYIAYVFYSPKYEAVRRDTMIESRTYSEASIRRLYDLKREWEAATQAGKAAIAATARHEFSIFPQDRLPADLSVWYSQIR